MVRMALLGVLLLLPAIVSAQVSLFSPEFDGYINRREAALCGQGPNAADTVVIVKSWEDQDRSSRGVVKFNLSGFPPFSRALSATLRLHARREINYATNTFLVSRIIESWSPTQATWCNRAPLVPWCQPGGCFTAAGQASHIIPAKFGGGYGDYNEWIEWDVTAIVNAWVQDGQPNYGFLIHQAPTDAPDDQEIQFASGDHALAASLTPELVLTMCQVSDDMPLVEDTQVNREGESDCGTNINESLHPEIRVYNRDSIFRNSRALFRFLLPTVPPSMPITDARLRLYATYESEYQSIGFRLSRITQDWTAFDANWCDRRPGIPWCSTGVCTTDSGQTVTVIPSLHNGGNGPYGAWVEFSATDIVRAWVEDAQPNYGFVLWQAPFTGGNQEIHFATKEYPDSAFRPQLYLCTEGGRVDVPVDPAPVIPSIRVGVAPNPMTRQTRLTVTAPHGPIQVTITDLAGRLVANIFSGVVADHQTLSITWDGNDREPKPVPSGIYFAVVRSTAGIQVGKIAVVR